MKTKILLSSLAVLGLASAASAGLHLTSRYNDYKVSFSGTSFASASLTADIHNGIEADAQGDAGTNTYGVPVTFSGLSVVGNADIAVSNVQTGSSLSATLTATTGQAGNIVATFGGPVTGGLGNFVGIGTFGGRTAMEIHAVSPGGVEDHRQYLYLFELSGDWSQAGTGPGQHEFLGINPAWTISQDFSYNAGIDTTFFAAYNNDYLNDGAHNIDLGIRLNGQPVPSPPRCWPSASARRRSWDDAERLSVEWSLVVRSDLTTNDSPTN